jgi:hypothetical protein
MVVGWHSYRLACSVYLHMLLSDLSPKSTGLGLDPNSKHSSCFLASRRLIVALPTDHSERVSQSLLIVGTRILSRRQEIGLSSHLMTSKILVMLQSQCRACRSGRLLETARAHPNLKTSTFVQTFCHLVLANLDDLPSARFWTWWIPIEEIRPDPI